MPLMGIASMVKIFRMRYVSSASLLTIESADGTRNYFYIFGGKDESSYMLIQGITLAGVMLDEVALMPESFVNQAIARCSVDGSRYWFNCNPESPNHWFYREWIQKAGEKNALHLHFLMSDNPGLSAEKLKEYETYYTGVFYDRYILGKWVAAEGLIYLTFANAPERFIKTDEELFCQREFEPVKIRNEGEGLPIMTVHIGVDFGGTKSATSFVATAITAGYQSAVVLAAERHAEALDPDRLGDVFVDFVLKIKSRYGRADCAYCDSAESILIRGIEKSSRKAGLTLRIRNAAKIEINDRIRLTCRLMAQGRLFLTADCAALADAFSQARWDADKLKDTRLDDGTSDIDTLDAFEYTIERDARRFIRSE